MILQVNHQGQLSGSNMIRRILFVSYVAGPLSGKGDMVYFEKINGQWLITKIEHKWIS